MKNCDCAKCLLPMLLPFYAENHGKYYGGTNFLNHTRCCNCCNAICASFFQLVFRVCSLFFHSFILRSKKQICTCEKVIKNPLCSSMNSAQWSVPNRPESQSFFLSVDKASVCVNIHVPNTTPHLYSLLQSHLYTCFIVNIQM